MSGVPSEVAHDLRGPAIGLNRAVSAVITTLEALCDPGLPAGTRDERSEDLYSQLVDTRLALTTFADAVLGPERPDPAVVDVAVSSWRRELNGRRPR